MKRWEWREGSKPPANLTAAQAGKELERIRNKRGLITPEVVVEEAKFKRSPLHSHIHGLDDEEAAYAFRLHRARNVVGAIRVREVNGKTGQQVRAFVNVVTANGREYVPAQEAADVAELREQVRQSLLVRLASVERELTGWVEFSGASAAVVEARERLMAA